MIEGISCECPVCGGTEFYRDRRTRKLACVRCRDNPIDVDSPDEGEPDWNRVL
jgi:uncharacterized protein (DUF983 family)